jgi:predicted nucleic acid-binding protein
MFPRPFSISSAHGFLKPLLESSTCVVLSETEEHQRVFEQSIGEVRRVSGNVLHDLHIAVVVREHGVKDILTRDRDFNALTWVAARPS